jgi:hypothetical protein
MLGKEGLDPEAWMREHIGHDAAYNTVRSEILETRQVSFSASDEVREG